MSARIDSLYGGEVACPHCRGFVKCSTCCGLGTVTKEHFERIKQGGLSREKEAKRQVDTSKETIMNLYLDIETVPCDDPEVINEIASTITPPGNYKKAETIATWEQHEKPRIVEEVVSKTSFDGGYGKIVCVGLGIQDDVYLFFDYSEERTLLLSLFEEISIYENRGLTFIGHNITWDLRMLYQRAVVHGIQPPRTLLKAAHAKPWSDSIADTMLMWSGPDRDKRVSLDKLCKFLGIQSPKGEIDGSKIAQYYKEGRLEEIAAYCKKDVEAVRACYKRLAFAQQGVSA